VRFVRPSDDDPFTPYRLVTALLEAGLPEDAVAFVPGGHDLVDAIVQACSLSVLFGGQPLADRYASNRSVRIHGPGRSKVVVLANADFDRTVADLDSSWMTPAELHRGAQWLSVAPGNWPLRRGRPGAGAGPVTACGGRATGGGADGRGGAYNV
jgi:hypothetical protein